MRDSELEYPKSKTYDKARRSNWRKKEVTIVSMNWCCTSKDASQVTNLSCTSKEENQSMRIEMRCAGKGIDDNLP